MSAIETEFIKMRITTHIWIPETHLGVWRKDSQSYRVTSPAMRLLGRTLDKSLRRKTASTEASKLLPSAALVLQRRNSRGSQQGPPPHHHPTKSQKKGATQVTPNTPPLQLQKALLRLLIERIPPSVGVG